MTIANTLRKTELQELARRVKDRAGQTCKVPERGTLGLMYIERVKMAFIYSLPEDDTDIYMHVKNRDERRWGVDADSVVSYHVAKTALDFGLEAWDYLPTKSKSTSHPLPPTAGLILTHHLRKYTRLLVTVLCDAAIAAHEEDPETPYLALVNTPGYMPEGEPVEFETIAEAWNYLADERRLAEEEADEDLDTYTDAVRDLRAQAKADRPQLGSLYGETPGYDGDHDLGVVYTVTNKGY